MELSVQKISLLACGCLRKSLSFNQEKTLEPWKQKVEVTLWDTWAPLTRLEAVDLTFPSWFSKKGRKTKSRKSFAPGWLGLCRLHTVLPPRSSLPFTQGWTRKAGLWETLYKSKQLCLADFITSVLDCSLVLNMVGFSPPATCPSWKHHHQRMRFLHIPSFLPSIHATMKGNRLPCMLAGNRSSETLCSVSSGGQGACKNLTPLNPGRITLVFILSFKVRLE